VETSTLRWILIIAGLIIVASIFFFGNPEKKRQPKASRKPKGEPRPRREPTLDSSEAAELEEEDPWEEGAEIDQGELDIGAPPPSSEVGKNPASGCRERPAGPAPDKILTLFLLARDNHRITGAELLQAAVSTGMEFGEMDIFHRVPEGSERSIFSMANAAKPGHFERDEWNTFETNGVALFMTLPGPMQALDAWDSMLATARRMSEILNAELLDEERNPFTRQKEAQLREEMREYDRRKT
jgi:cell division protein ZipA